MAGGGCRRYEPDVVIMLAHRISMRPTAARELIEDVGPEGPIYMHDKIRAFEVRLSGLHLSCLSWRGELRVAPDCQR